MNGPKNGIQTLKGDIKYIKYRNKLMQDRSNEYVVVGGKK